MSRLALAHLAQEFAGAVHRAERGEAALEEILQRADRPASRAGCRIIASDVRTSGLCT